jgi:hypothetical protein
MAKQTPTKAANQVTGTVQYIGKSRFTEARMETRAKDLAKQRATKKLDTCLKGLASEGKCWNKPQITAQYFVNGSDVIYVLRADFE